MRTNAEKHATSVLLIDTLHKACDYNATLSREEALKIIQNEEDKAVGEGLEGFFNTVRRFLDQGLEEKSKEIG